MLTSDELQLMNVIRSDIAARNIFFSKVEHPKFFFPLKAEGYFDASSLPEAIEIGGGHQFPYWTPTTYLQKIAAKINKGECSDLIDNILLIVEEVTNQIDIGRLNNKRPYFFFVDILTKMPNGKISTTYLKKILPVWLEVGDTFYTSPEIIEKLIPKFLNEDASKDNKEKSELVLRAVLNADLYLPLIADNAAPRRFNRDLYWLNKVIVKEELYKKIATQLDNTIVFYIADQLKATIWSQFPHSKYEFTYGGRTFDFTLMPSIDQGLQIVLRAESEVKFIIPDFNKLNDDELSEAVIKRVPEYNLVAEKLEDFNDKLRNAIRFGVSGDSSVFRSKSFFEEDDDKDYDVESSLTTYLQKISESVAESDPERGAIIIRSFLSNTYRSAVFKRLAIYLITKNWNAFKGIFTATASAPNRPGPHCSPRG